MVSRLILDVQNYNAEFNALQQQLAILREEKLWDIVSLPPHPLSPASSALYESRW